MAHAHPTYDMDKRFVIDVETKKIIAPKTSVPTIVQYDNYSEVITFEIARYVEGHDLSISDKVEVHYNNISADGRRTSKGLYYVEDYHVDLDDSSKVIVTWYVSEQATTYEGTLNFIVSFSCLESSVDNAYRWNSGVGTLPVGASINNTEYIERNYADVLETWKQTLFGIGDTEEASMLAVSARQQQLMELKGQEVLDSIPNAYMDYAAFEKSKANVTDLNRFFDSDWISKRRTNYFPYGDSSFEYDGTTLNDRKQIGGTFYLEEGAYNLIITDTNAIGVYVTHNNGAIRVKEIENDIIGIHELNITSEYANKPLEILYYASGSTANTAGTYYLKRPYIFKIGEEAIFSDEFFVKPTEKLLESDIIKSQKGNNLYTAKDIEFYYDGTSTNYGFNSSIFTLDEGDYALTILDSNALNFVIYVVDTAATGIVRLLNTPDKPANHRFTVPSEYAGKSLALFINSALDAVGTAGTYYAKSIYIFKDDGVPYFPEYLTNNITERLSGQAYKSENGYLSATKSTMNSGEELYINAICNVKTNKSLSFTANISSFSGLRLGHGKVQYGGSYIEIDNSNISIYQYNSSAEKSGTYSHGLSISSFITVIINVGVDIANITIFTSSGSYTVNCVPWSGCNGTIFATSIDSTFTNCELKWTSSSIKERVWVFGDSYVGFSDDRWAGQMHNLGYKNWLASGYPGGNSYHELESFKTLLQLGIPDVAIWCLGMNDGDNGEINSNWLRDTTEFIRLCKDKNITIILATIPSCPAVDNTYKNNWVRSSRRRYIDFDKAVRVNGTTWYDGMLSSDNIHPTELGAKALASRVCIDAPEIMQSNIVNTNDVFIDSATGKRYKLHVLNGELRISELKSN